jgi:hypothetical protein
VDALRRNGALERLDLSGNSVRDECAVVILKVLTAINCSLMWLNLEGNAAISPVLEEAIDFVLASRRVLKSFCKRLRKPLDKKLIPLAIHGARLSSICHKNPELVQPRESMPGPMFLLVRAAALNDSKVVKEVTCATSAPVARSFTRWNSARVSDGPPAHFKHEPAYVSCASRQYTL